MTIKKNNNVQAEDSSIEDTLKIKNAQRKMKS